MKTPDGRRKELPWLIDNSIPAANPADLKTLWNNVIPLLELPFENRRYFCIRMIRDSQRNFHRLRCVVGMNCKKTSKCGTVARA